MNIKIMSFVVSVLVLLCACEQSGMTKISSDEIPALSAATQQDINLIAETLDVTYRLITNIPSKQCDANIADGACFEVELSFTANQPIKSNNWQIVFSQISPIQSYESDEFSVVHLNGDLHQITLKESFTGFNKGETKSLLFRAMFWSLSEYDAIPNYIVNAKGLDAKVIDSTRAKIDPDTGLEILPFVAPYTDKNKQSKRSQNDASQWLTSQDLYDRNASLGLEKLDVSRQIIPTPKYIELNAENKRLDISSGLTVQLNNVTEQDVQVALVRLATLGVSFSNAGIPLKLTINENDQGIIGAYTLEVSSDQIAIVAGEASGVFNGLQSLASLYVIDSQQLSLITVRDEPHYQFRGLLVDVARNFHSKTFILRLLDQMAAYKLNKLHLHLGDDEGWRLAIPSLPELTEIGGTRCLDFSEQQCLLPQLGAGVDPVNPVNGYFSVADYQDILKAASARHIQVIPSLDMPGHSRAAVKAMAARYNKYSILEETDKAKQFLLSEATDPTKYSSVQFYNDNTINVCLESSYAFVKEVMTQVKAMHDEVGHPLSRYHIGADETAGAWLESPACKDFIADPDNGVKDASGLAAYFVERVAGILFELGIEPAAWSDGLEHTKKANMPPVVQANAWGHLPWGAHRQTHELANRNWQIVVSTPDAMYFDFPYETDPKEHGYYWASRHTNTEKVFQFMPDNLPVHAEFWLDREDNPYVADDTIKRDEQGNIIAQPLQPGRTFYGLQGQLWSENTRSDAMSEHKIFPRLFALAERAWYLPNWAVPYNYQGARYDQSTHAFSEQKRQLRDQAWQLFANTLGQKELPKLDKAQIQYRLPTIGAVIKDGILRANVAFPGLGIEYLEAGKDWQPYLQPVAVTGNIKVRSRSSYGRRFGRITAVN
ncbi:family 20 glycosylhydrolase [Colwelliaceae bacterium 6471]